MAKSFMHVTMLRPKTTKCGHNFYEISFEKKEKCPFSNKIRKSQNYRLSKFYRFVVVNLKANLWIFGVYTNLFLIWKLNHVLMSNIWEKAISISAVNLNSGFSCLITNVNLNVFFGQQDWLLIDYFLRFYVEKSEGGRF